MASMKGRFCVVTGASTQHGIGNTIAKRFAEAGASVFLVAEGTKEQLETAQAECRAYPDAGTIEYGIYDLSVSGNAEAMIADAHKRFGRIDVLVNNAGIGHKVSIEEEDLDTFRQAMELNVTALWHLSKLSSPSMIANGGGSIVNIASMLGHVWSTPIKQAHYCASKGAVVNLTREMALQWARKGVRVTALCPGWFPSERTAGMDSDEGSQQFIRANSPIPRMGAEHELDGALLLLATPAGSFMTGQNVIVDGGWTAR